MNKSSSSKKTNNTPPDLKRTKAFEAFSASVEKAKQQLLTGLKLKQFDIIDSSRQEVIEYKQKLQQSKTHNEELSRQVQKLKDEKRAGEKKLQRVRDALQKLCDGLKDNANSIITNNKSKNEELSESPASPDTEVEKKESDQILKSIEQELQEILSDLSPRQQRKSQNTSSADDKPNDKQPVVVKEEAIIVEPSTSNGNEITISHSEIAEVQVDDDEDHPDDASQESSDGEMNTDEVPRSRMIERFIKIVPYKIKIEPASPEREVSQDEFTSKGRFQEEDNDDEGDAQLNVVEEEHEQVSEQLSSSTAMLDEGLRFFRNKSEESSSKKRRSHADDDEDSEAEVHRRKIRKTHSQESHDSNNATFYDTENSVLSIPEMYRLNHGFADNWELDSCPHSKRFWYDPVNSHKIKFLVRFYNDSGNLNTKRLVIKVQTGLQEPKTFHLNIVGINEKLLEKLPQSKRIWLDVRDFNVFGRETRQLFLSLGGSISHFSLGKRLYSFDELQASSFLEFVFKYLPNLEYLCVNDWMLRNLDGNFQVRKTNYLPKLKVIRLITTKFRVTTRFVNFLMTMAPNLEAVYGLPLHCVRELKRLSPRPNMDTIKSVFPVRFRYSKDDVTIQTYHDDLSSLSRLNPTLEELDSRLFFVPRRFYEIRLLCSERFGRIIRWNAKVLKKLTIEAVKEGEHIEIPVLNKLETIQLDVTISKKFNSSFFPDGFDLNNFFPNLKAVDIVLDEKSAGAVGILTKRKAQLLFYELFPKDVFRAGEVFQGVEKLTLHNYIPKDCMSNLRSLFPHITVLTLAHNLVEFTHILPTVYESWPDLRVLTLHISFNILNRNLDSAFTGIPVSRCKSLRRILENPAGSTPSFTKRNIDKYKDKIAITHLKDLMLLKIVLRNVGWQRDHSSEDCLMSPVSALYGFETMKALKIVVAFDERCDALEIDDMLSLLEPVRPYVYVDW